MNRLGLIRAAVWAAVLLGSPAVWAQVSDADRIQELERQVAEQKRIIRDFGGLIHYGSDNSELKPPQPGENRVIFFGDQITEYWGKEPNFVKNDNMDDQFFPGKHWLNRGVAGQTTDQMLVRFRQDVIDLHPRVVIIQGGLNDVAGLHGGPATEETVLDNTTSMTELAKVNGIQVILASLTPVCDCFIKTKPRERWQERIKETNELIEKYAHQVGAVYLDYYSAMAEDDDMKKDLTRDGVIPNEAGYKIMADLAEKAIVDALGKK